MTRSIQFADENCHRASDMQIKRRYINVIKTFSKINTRVTRTRFDRR